MKLEIILKRDDGNVLVREVHPVALNWPIHFHLPEECSVLSEDGSLCLHGWSLYLIVDPPDDPHL